jgi:hypothetical protein
MSNARFLPIAILTALSINGFAQSSTTAPAQNPAADTAKKTGPLPSVMGGIGVLYFNGNINRTSSVTPFSTVRAGYSFAIEERPVSFLGIQLDGMIGKLATSKRSNNPDSNFNFQMNVFQGELTINLHFDGLILKKDAVIAPFIYTGISYMSYSNYADQKDANGNPYYYWTDGSIRNEPQNAQDVITAKIVQRDYTYETFLNSGSSINIPIGIGAKFRITENIAMNVQAANYYLFSNPGSLEGYKNVGTKSDSYLYAFATLEYHFTHHSSTYVDESRYTAFTGDPTFIQDTVKHNTSSDMSAADEAAANEKATKNFLDTNNSLSRQEAEEFWAHPNGKQLTTIDKKNESGAKKYDYNKLPPRFRPADKNKDGYISSTEITQAIDEFFDGTSVMTIADINALIDYFFDQ